MINFLVNFPLQEDGSQLVSDGNSSHHSQESQDSQASQDSQPARCIIQYTLSTSIASTNIEIEQLPVVDVLPWLPLCDHVTCDLQVGPLCFRQDSQMFGGG